MMKLITARPPSASPSNPTIFPGLIVYAKGSRGLTTQGDPDPYRGAIINILEADDPFGLSCTISGSPGACQLSGLNLSDGDSCSILWSNIYPVGEQFKMQYGYGPMIYNAATGLLEDTAATWGQDWTKSHWWDEQYREYVDFTPQHSRVYAFVNCTVTDICIYWDVAPRWPPGASCVACMVPQSAIVSGPPPDYPPIINNYDGYAWPLDWYWEWVYYDDIFP